MKIARYMRERMFSLLPNRNSTAGYPYTAAGNPCRVENPSSTRPQKVQVFGNSTQQTYTGKNLLPPSDAESKVTGRGITFTNNGDGTYTIDGDCTEVIYFRLGSIKLPEGTYVLSGCPAGGSIGGYRMEIELSRDVLEETGTGLTITVAAGTQTYFDLYIAVGKGTAVPNLVFKPQIERGTVKTAFEPYVGGKSSPSPEYPQAIESTGDISKSLIEYAQVENWVGSPVENLVITDAYIDVPTKGEYVYNQIPLPKLKAGQPYTLWWEVEIYDRDAGTGTTSTCCGFKNTGVNSQSNALKNATLQRVVTYTPAEDTESEYIFFATNYGNGANRVQAKAKWKIMVLEGEYTLATIPRYAPKGKCGVQVSARGKNILNAHGFLGGKDSFSSYGVTYTKIENGGILVNGTATQNSNIGNSLYIEDSLEHGKTYTLTVRDEHGNFITANSTGDIQISMEAKGPNVPTVWTNKLYYAEGYNLVRVYFQCATGCSPNNMQVFIQIEEGETGTAYEPYFNQAVNLYLDEPLRKIGEHADCIDWDRGVVVRKVGVYTIPVTQTWWEWQTVNGSRIIMWTSDKKTSGDTLGMFTIGGVNQNLNSVENKEKSNTIYAFAGTYGTYWYPDWTAMGLDGTEAKSVANQKLREWLAGLPLKEFTYVLAEPTETPITLPKLPFAPKQTNIYTVDAKVPGKMQLQYYSFDHKEEAESV